MLDEMPNVDFVITVNCYLTEQVIHINLRHGFSQVTKQMNQIHSCYGA